jgi:hypothetical protein
MSDSISKLVCQVVTTVLEQRCQSITMKQPCIGKHAPNGDKL